MSTKVKKKKKKQTRNSKTRVLSHTSWYLGMKLGHWPKFQKLQIYPLSTTRGRNWAYIRSTGSGFQDTGLFSKLPYLGMKLGHWPKFQNLHIPSFYPIGLKLSLFSFYGQRFPRYGTIFKIGILGMKLGHCPKFQNLHYILSFYLIGSKLSLFLLYGQRFPR